MLSKGEFANSKMAAVQPYYLTDRNHFQGNTFGNKTIHRQDNSSTRFLETIHRHN